VLDLAFTVYKHIPGQPCRVEIRRTWPSGQRANWVIGTVAFSDHKLAKSTIESLVLNAYVNFSVDKQDEARENFLKEMLVLSIPNVPTDWGGTKGANVYYGGTTHWASGIVTGSSTPAPAPELEVVDLTPSTEMINSLMESFDMNKAVEVMMDNIQEVEAAATAAIEPEVPKTITIGGQTINLGWPS